MDERTIAIPAEQPVHPPVAGPNASAAALGDPRALTILTTEHWSLLSARSLVYNEAFARAGMFLTFLSATLVALGLLSTATGFSREFLSVAAVVIGLDLFVGLATMGRVAAATTDDMRCLQGMNRIRHAYHELVPGLERYFISGRHDDMRGVFSVYGTTETVASGPGILHGLTTTVGMIGVMCAALGGVLLGIATLLAGLGTLAAGLVAVVAFVAGIVASIATMIRQVDRFGRSLEAHFPSPNPAEPPGRPEA